MNRNLHEIICIFAFVVLLAFVAPVNAQDDVTERSEMIKTQNALRIFREFEHDTRHLYFIMSTAIISFEGGWFAREAALGLTYAENLREVGKNVYLPKSNRLLARLDGNKFLNDEEKSRMSDVANQMLHLIELSH